MPKKKPLFFNRMDKAVDKSMTDEYLEKYAAEFCTHEELMKPARNTKTQSWARKQALSKLGAVFDCTELKVILREVRAFKQQCVNKMRLLVRQTHGSGDGALALAPPWLQKMNRPFELVTAALKLESLYEGPQSHSQRVNQFTWDLYCSVRNAVQAVSSAYDAAALLRNDAVAEFAEQKGLAFETVRDIWRRVYDSALVKLRESSRTGDRPDADQPQWLDWRIIDLALLYSREKVVVRLSFSNPAEVEAMLQLYMLMSEAHTQLEKDSAYDQNTTTTTTTTTTNTTSGSTPAEESKTATDQSQIGRQVENGAQNGTTDNTNGTGPSCSSAGNDEQAESDPVTKSPSDEVVWESPEIWTKLHADYCKSRRAVSLVALQRRWFELKVLARRGILLALHDSKKKAHPLLLAIVKRFPHVVTLPPVSWSHLVAEKRIYVEDFVSPVQTESTKTEDPNPALMNELIADLLDWSDDELEIVDTDQSQYIDSDTEQDAGLPTDTTLGALNTELRPNYAITQQETNTSSKECTQTEETSTEVISEPLDNRYTNKTIKTQTAFQQQTAQLDGIDAKVKENPENIIERIIPTKSKSRITFEDEDDLDQLYNFDTNYENLSMYIDQMVNANYKTKPIEKDKRVEVKREKESPVKSSSHQRFNDEVKMEPVGEHSEVNSGSGTLNSEVPQKSNDKNDTAISALNQNYCNKVPSELNDTLYTQADKDAVSICGEKSSSEVNSDLSEQCSEDGSVCNYIDEKLLKLSRVVLIPLDQIPAWQFARGATIDCRQFCVEQFAAPVALSPRQLNRARRYRPMQAPCDDAPGLSRVLLARFSNMPHEYKVMRRKLTSRLRLSRTFLSVCFWSSERNVVLLHQCKPVHVALARLARVVKRVELADIEEVRRINRAILTAQVAPIGLEAQNVPNRPSDTSELPPWEFLEACGNAAPPPSVEELKKMIKKLAIPSITVMREANAYLRAQLEHERVMLNYREEERAKAQRDENKRLDNDIRQLVKSLGEGECQQRAKRIVKKVLVLGDDEKPLPDAYQEWQRQKTLVHKYFSFPTPKQAGNKTGASKVRNTGTADDLKRNTCQNKIDLMSVSDDEESPTGNDLIGNLNKETQSVNDAKRSRSDKETSHSFKRVKLAEDTAHNDNEDKSTKSIAQNVNDGKDPNNEDDSDDENRMIIDEGIENCCTEDGTLILTDRLTTKPSHPADSQLTVWPSNAVSGLDKHHDTSKNIVFIIKSTNEDCISKSSRIIPTTSIINTIGVPRTYTLNTALTAAVNTGVIVIANTSTPNTTRVPGGTSFRQKSIPTTCTNTNAIQTASTFNTFKLPDDVSLTLNTPVTTSVNTMLPKLSSIKSGTETIIEESAERTIQPKTVPISPTKRKHTGGKIVKRSRPGPLSSKPKIISSISHATTVVGFSKDTPLSKTDEKIDQTDNFAENDTTKKQVIPRIVSTAFLKLIKTKINKHSTEIDPVTNTDAKENNSMSDNRIYSTSNKTENNELRFLFFPIQKHSAMNKPVNIKTTNKTNDVMKNICLDSDDSDKIKKQTNVDCTLKKKDLIEVDSSSNETESRFVDVVEPPSEMNATDLVPPKTIFEGQASDQVPNAASVTQVAHKRRKSIPAKITANTTSKELLRLPPKELARLLKDDNTKTDTDMKEKNTETPTNTTPRAFIPIKIKQKRRWAEEIELSKDGRGSKKVCTKGVEIKNKPGAFALTPETNSTGKNGVPAESEELFLQGVLTTCVMKSTHPDEICNDSNLLTIRDLGKTEIDVLDYARQMQDPEEPLLKMDLTQPLWLLAEKYLLLTDDAVDIGNPTFVTSHRAGTLAPYCAVRFPDRTQNKQILNLGAKKGRDVIICGCNGNNSCLLCQSIGEQDGRAPEFIIYKPKFRKVCHACGVDPQRERARLFTIKQRQYRKIGDRPLKFVMVDVAKHCGVCRDGVQFVARPDALLINNKHYEKISDEPLMYAPVLCVLQSAERAARLAALDSELFLLNVHTARWNRVLFRPDDRFGPFNAAVRTLMSKMDREEVDMRYRRKLDNKLSEPL